MSFRWHKVLGVAVLALALLAGPAARAQAGGEALVLTLDGALTPAMLNYLQRGLAQAGQDGSALLVIQLNTPGGQIDLMEKIVAAIRNSATPVIIYITPRGAMAGSAGTVITLAGHAAAMAPETAIGAASPVGSQGEDLGTTAETKAKEVLKAQVRSLANRRGEAAVAMAEAAIESAKAATADEALAAGLVDFIAVDLDDLLQRLDGFPVEVNGQPQTLHTRDLRVVDLAMSFMETLLNLLTNPNVVFLLLAIGAQAILIELSSPGGWVAGFLGVVSLLLAFYGLGVLPVNWFGILFIVTAFVLFIIDITATAHGALTVAGVGSLIMGALVLFNSPMTPSFFHVNVPLVVGTALAMGAAFFVLLTVALRAQRLPVKTGVESLVGQVGEARSPDQAQVAGELWSVEPAEGALQPGDRVEVLAVKGLRLRVRKTGTGGEKGA